jgi:hypothetical protein
MARPILNTFTFIFCLLFLTKTSSASNFSNRKVQKSIMKIALRTNMNSLLIQEEKKQVKENKPKDRQKPTTTPEIKHIPKARKQAKPTMVKPHINVKPIKVIRPKIKRP